MRTRLDSGPRIGSGADEFGGGNSIMKTARLVGTWAAGIAIIGGSIGCGAPGSELSDGEPSVAQSVEATFAPVRLIMKGPQRLVLPKTIVWNRPDYMYLIEADVLPGDSNPTLLPATRPFSVTGQYEQGGISYGTLSFDPSEAITWEPAFVANRKIILTMNVDGADEDLYVSLRR
jgi:hypothetical protein